MLPCDTIKQVLSDFIENTIEPALKEEVQNHLASCASCKKVYVQVQSITSTLHSMSGIQTSQSFDQKLRSQIINDRTVERPAINIKNISYGLSGLAVIAGAYIISTADILTFDKSVDGSQQNQTISAKPSLQSSPVVLPSAGAERDVLAADTLKSSPSNLEERDLQLINNQ